MKKNALILKKHKGSTMIIVAMALTVLLMMAAIVFDLGICYYETSSLQNAVDAAALAAGMKLPVDTENSEGIDNLKQTALEYLQKNGVSGNSVNVEPDGLINNKYTTVKVSATTNVQTSFAKIINVNQISITRSAAAQISPSIESTGIVPLSIDSTYMKNAIATGQTSHITLKFGATSGVQGSFGALDLDGSTGGGANDYDCNLLYGYSGDIFVGTTLDVEPGNMSGPTFSSFWSRYDSCTHFSGYGGCTIDHYVKDCPRVVMVPVVQYIDSKSVTICGFAAFVLEAGTGNGTESTVTGSIVNVVKANGKYDTGGFGGSDDYGVYTVHLCN